MKYNLDLNNRAFKAIRNGTKKIEIRVTTNKKLFDYGKIKNKDILIFNNANNEKLRCEILNVNWYKTPEELLEKEGTIPTLSSTSDFNEGIRSIKNIPGYCEGIKKNGIYAIRIKLI